MNQPFTFFHKDATRGYRISEVGAGLAPARSIEVLYLEPAQAVLDFAQRWNVELDAVCHPSLYSGGELKGGPVTAQLLTALSLALTEGNPSYYRYNAYLKKYASDREFPAEFLSGNGDRDIFAHYGLFAIPLPIARIVLRQPNLSGPDLQAQPLLAFQATALWIANISSVSRGKSATPNAQRGVNEVRQVNMDAVEIALEMVLSARASGSSGFKISYPGNYLQKFIGYYNQYHQLIQTKETNHAPENTRNTEV